MSMIFVSISMSGHVVAAAGANDEGVVLLDRFAKRRTENLGSETRLGLGGRSYFVHTTNYFQARPISRKLAAFYACDLGFQLLLGS